MLSVSHLPQQRRLPAQLEQQPLSSAALPALRPCSQAIHLPEQVLAEQECG